MEERVSIETGNVPILLVCPHGYDDNNTAIITESCANSLGAYALINHGWRRSSDVDELAGYANCNSVNHCMNTNNTVVYDEYGSQFIKLRHKILKKHGFGGGNGFYILHIHGVGNHIKKKAGDNVHMIMGFGNSKKKPQLTCEEWVKDAFAKCVEDQGLGNVVVYQGKPGGNYTARKNDNMNQYYRHYTFEPNIQSIQLEITYDLRDDEQIADHTGKFLAGCLHQLLSYDNLNPSLHWPTLKEI